MTLRLFRPLRPCASAVLFSTALLYANDQAYSPDEELKTFKVEAPLHAELVAAEPQVESPCAMAFDEQGRLYVAGGLNKPNPPAEPAKDVKGGIYVFSPEGNLLTFLQVPRD